MQTLNVKNIDNKHSEWKNILGFYKDELNIFRERLNEIAGKYTSKEVMQMVEHFQNQFLVQSESIDTLQHDINAHLNTIAKAAMLNAGHVAKDLEPAHTVLQERVERETVIFKDIKVEFMKFLSKLM